MTQYERDFDRVSATVRKEVIRFEVRVSDQAQLISSQVSESSLVKCFHAITERKSQEVQKSDHQVPGVSASVSTAGERLSKRPSALKTEIRRLFTDIPPFSSQVASLFSSS